MLPNSNHNLYKSTFRSQKDLLSAWEIVKELKIKVIYHGVHDELLKKEIYTSQFNVDYDVFMVALREKDGNIRNLEVFVESEGTK